MVGETVCKAEFDGVFTELEGVCSLNGEVTNGVVAEGVGEVEVGREEVEPG
ncbi:9942_t:CDS:1, partial [Acaulospora colombiana]